MLRDGWNFHGDIAIPLEGIALRHYGDIMRPFGKIYDADAIEHGSFVEVMMTILREETGMKHGYPEIDNFVNDCAPYIGVSGHAIPKEVAADLFERFKQLYN